jgi:hypothetical protein
VVVDVGKEPKCERPLPGVHCDNGKGNDGKDMEPWQPA